MLPTLDFSALPLATTPALAAKETLKDLASMDWFSWGLVTRLAVTLLMGAVIWKGVQFTLSNIERGLLAIPLQREEHHHKRISAIFQILENATNWLFAAVLTILILGELGINTMPLLAGAGIFGAAMAFGAQNLIKDVISGFFLAAEAHFGPGDLIQVAGITGRVERMTFRNITLLDSLNKRHIFPNSEISRFTLCPSPAEWESMEWELSLHLPNEATHTEGLAHQAKDYLAAQHPEEFHEGPSVVYLESIALENNSHTDTEKDKVLQQARFRLRAKGRIGNYAHFTQTLRNWLEQQQQKTSLPHHTLCGWLSTLPNTANSPIENQQ